MLEYIVRGSSGEFAWKTSIYTPPALPGGAEMKSLNRKRFTQQGVERLRYDKTAAPPSGRIEIEYYDFGDLDRLFNLILRTSETDLAQRSVGM